jgi:hypothetical protein
VPPRFPFAGSVHYLDGQQHQQICPGATARAQRQAESMNENFSLIVMCLFLLASLAFLAQQLTSYH